MHKLTQYETFQLDEKIIDFSQIQCEGITLTIISLSVFLDSKLDMKRNKILQHGVHTRTA